MSDHRHDPYIHFAIAPGTRVGAREGMRERVAERFDGIAATTEQVGVRDFGRLYRMQTRFDT